MSISTYTELQTAVGNWMNRGDLSSRIPEFIAMAESRINRRLRLLQQETLATRTYGSGDTTRRVSLPTGFLELLSLAIKADTEPATSYVPLTYKAPEHIADYIIAGSGKPEVYTLRDEIEFNRTAGSDYTVRIHYLKRWDIANDTTNWLLTNVPDVYLFGALACAEPYVKNDSRMPVWKSQFDEAMAELNLLDNRSRDQTEMELDQRLSTYARYSIVADR